ncbi:hypothetical protein EP7_005116 [Isosphaeraceae bacterium EP7]
MARAADHDRIVALRPIHVGHRSAAPQEIDFDEMSRAVEDRRAFGPVLRLVLAIVRHAEQFHDRDDLASPVAPDDEMDEALDLFFRVLDPDRGFGFEEGDAWLVSPAGADEDVGSQPLGGLLRRQFLDEDVSFEQGDISGRDLGDELFLQGDEEGVVDVGPERFVFEIGVHPWER